MNTAAFSKPHAWLRPAVLDRAEQVAIVLLSSALIAQSRRIVQGACGMAGLGLLLALYTLVGGTLP